MAIRSVVLMALLLAGPASAAKYVLQPVPADDQQTTMDAGVAAIQSNQSRSAIRVRGSSETFSERATLQVIAMNGDEKPFNFGTENVTASLPNGEVLHVLTVRELHREERRRMAWAALAAGLAAAGNNIRAANAGYSNSYGTFNTNTYGQVGSTPFYGNSFTRGSVTTYNAGQAYAAQSLANRQNAQIFANLANQKAAGLQEIKDVIATTTIAPGGAYGGLLQFDIPGKIRTLAKKTPVRIKLSFQAAGETHQIQMELVRSK